MAGDDRHRQRAEDGLRREQRGRRLEQDFRVVSDSTAPTGGALTVNGVAASGGGTTSYDTDGSFTIGTRTD